MTGGIIIVQSDQQEEEGVFVMTRAPSKIKELVFHSQSILDKELCCH